MTMAGPDEDTRQDHGTAADAPFEVDITPTGHAQVDGVLDRLAELADRPLAAHGDVYDDVHQRLRGILAEPAPGRGEDR